MADLPIPAFLTRKYRLIRNRAANERFRPTPIRLKTLDYKPDIDSPRYVIRAVYGPVNGIPTSRIQTYKYQDRYKQQRGTDQLNDLHHHAIKRRMYDAADWMKERMK